jgi:hypothetical protein
MGAVFLCIEISDFVHASLKYSLCINYLSATIFIYAIVPLHANLYVVVPK